VQREERREGNKGRTEGGGDTRERELGRAGTGESGNWGEVEKVNNVDRGSG
jgi:hypothetical protein